MNLQLCEMSDLPEHMPHQIQPLFHFTVAVLSSGAAFLEGDTYVTKERVENATP